MSNAVPRLSPHDCTDRNLADALLSEAQRAHAVYRSTLRRLIHERSDDEIDELRDHFDPRRADDLPPQAGLVLSDIRIACNQEKRSRVAWADIEQEVGS